MESIRFKTYEKELIIMKYTVDIPRRVSVITDGKKVADVNTNYIKARNKPEQDPKLLNKMYVNTDSSTTAKVTFVDPEKSDNEYSYVKEMLVNNAITVPCASHFITQQFAHNVIHAAYKDNAVNFMQDCNDDLNRYLFKDIEDLITMHLNAFTRYNFMKMSNRNYFSIKYAVKLAVEHVNEYYGFVFNYDDFEKEIDKIYEIFQ
jgi:hypothetical protein